MMPPDPGSGVILADDDALLRGIVRSILVNAGQTVYVATNGSEAVAFARQFRARLVMLDVGMPTLNGLLACKAIRDLAGYVSVPIVMLTCYTDERIRSAAFRIGANCFLTKPFRPDRLVAELAGYLGLPPTGQPSNESAALEGAAKPWIDDDTVWASRDNRQLNAGREALLVIRQAEHEPQTVISDRRADVPERHSR